MPPEAQMALLGPPSIILIWFLGVADWQAKAENRQRKTNARLIEGLDERPWIFASAF